MKTLYIIHFGIGNVGRELIKQIFANKKRIQKDYHVELVYTGIFGSKGGFFNQKGFSELEINRKILQLTSSDEINPRELIKRLPESYLQQSVIIDTTTSDAMYPILLEALKKKACVVMANKRPLAGSLSEFNMLHKFGQKKLAYETTVGAGLPIIKVVQELLATGDRIMEITGCFSGTLGFLCSSLEEGAAFSKSVALAKQKGFTETDPRADLSGADVARKALILARMLGNNKEMKDIQAIPWYPDSFSNYSIEKFMKEIKSLDTDYEKKFKNALQKKKTFRYVASITKNTCEIKLKEFSQDSPLGRLKGADNIIIIKTQRYYERPLIIQGPGAGIDVTAAGVFADVLSVAKIIQGDTL